MKRREKVLSKIRFRRFSTVQLLIVLGVFFISAPFVEEIKGGELIVSILFSLVLALRSLPLQRANAFWSLQSCLPFQGSPAGGSTIFGRSFFHLQSFWLPAPPYCFCNRASARLYTARARGYCRSALREHFAYLMLGLIWTMAYWLVDQLTPGGAFSFNTNAGPRSIEGFSGFYFSFITLSTVGYGDITPVSRIARWLAAMEAMIGLALCGSPHRTLGRPLPERRRKIPCREFNSKIG